MLVVMSSHAFLSMIVVITPECVICRIILLLQQGFSYICSNGCQCTGSRLGMGTAFAGVGISVVERGWS